MPTIYRKGPFRFFFNSREELRMHVHVEGPGGTAKFWLEPSVALAGAYGLGARHLARVSGIVEEHRHEFIAAWKAHFGK